MRRTPSPPAANTLRVPGSPADTDALYTRYAAQYDRQGQGQWSQALICFALAVLLPRYHRRPRTALDLACGTGTAALLLARTGLAVTGLDRSRAMLAVAAAKAWTVGTPLHLVRGDLRAFGFARSFDLITCCYDSLNYLLDPADLAGAFGQVRGALAPGGLFIGDLNTARAYTGPASAPRWELDLGDVAYRLTTVWDPATRRAVVTIEWATRTPGRTESLRERHPQRAYEPAEVEAALEAGGLRSIGEFAAKPLHGPTLEPPGPETARIIYVAEAATVGGGAHG